MTSTRNLCCHGPLAELDCPEHCPDHLAGKPKETTAAGTLQSHVHLCKISPLAGATGCQERRAPCSNDKEWKTTNISGIGRDQGKIIVMTRERSHHNNGTLA